MIRSDPFVSHVPVFKSRTRNAATPSTRRRLGPYFFVGSRPFREARIRGYVISQHRLGRGLSDILTDEHLRRLGSPSLIWKVVCQPETIAALEADVAEEIQACRARLQGALHGSKRTPA